MTIPSLNERYSINNCCVYHTIIAQNSKQTATIIILYVRTYVAYYELPNMRIITYFCRTQQASNTYVCCISYTWQDG